MASIEVYDEVLDSRLVASAYSIVKRWLVPPSLFWIDRRHIDGGAIYRLLAPYFGGVVGRFLRNCVGVVIEKVTPDVWQATSGIEIWTGVTTTAQPTFFLHI